MNNAFGERPLKHAGKQGEDVESHGVSSGKWKVESGKWKELNSFSLFTFHFSLLALLFFGTFDACHDIEGMADGGGDNTHFNALGDFDSSKIFLTIDIGEFAN